MVAKDDDDGKKFDKSVDALEMEMLNPPPGGSSGAGGGSAMKSPKMEPWRFKAYWCPVNI